MGESNNYGAAEAAASIRANHTGLGAIDTGDWGECAFIFAAVELALTDPATADRLSRLMEERRIKNAMWPMDDWPEADTDTE